MGAGKGRNYAKKDETTVQRNLGQYPGVEWVPPTEEDMSIMGKFPENEDKGDDYVRPPRTRWGTSILFNLTSYSSPHILSL